MATLPTDEIHVIKTRLTMLENDMSQLRDDTQTIITIIGGASKAGRLVKIHGPRVVAAVLAWLIAKGNIDDATLALVKAILGIG